MKGESGDNCGSVATNRRGFFHVVARWWWMELLAWIMLPVLGAALAGSLESMRPKLYQSVAVVEVVAPDRSGGGETLVRTICERMTSLPVLDGAAKALNEDSPPSAARVRAKVVPGTRLIRLTVRDESARRACDLAREVTRTFRTMLLAEEESSRSKTNEELKREIRVQEDRVEQTRKLLFQIGRVKGIGYAPGAEVANPSGDRLLARGAELDLQVDSLESRIKALDNSPVECALAFSMPPAPKDDPVAAVYLAWIAASGEAKRERDKSEPNEETIRVLDRCADSAKADLDARVGLVRLALSGELAAVRTERDSIRERVSREVVNRVIASYDRYDFDEAKADFDRESAVLGRMKEDNRMNVLAAKLSAPPVEVREQPMEARSPCVPRPLFRAAQGGLAGLALAVLATVPLALLLEGFSAHRAERRAARLFRKG